MIGIATTGMENHEWLQARYAARLLEQAPKSILDVGCGAGQLLREFHDHGVEAIGLDRPGPKLEVLQEGGYDARAGSAYELPFDDRSVDWISLRHVPHHLEDPGRALAEALRVARTGVLVAEPHFEVSIPSQRGAEALDIWEKRQHRRGGMYHAEVLDVVALLALLPRDVERTHLVELETHLSLSERSIDEFRAEALALIEDLAVDHAERTSLDALLTRLEELGLSWNGSLLLTLRRRTSTSA